MTDPVNQNSDAALQWQWKSYEQLSKAELEAIYRLRQQVFIIEQNCPYPDIDGEDHFAIHLLGRREAKLVAYLRFFPESTHYPGDTSLGRVCTDAAARGSGAGRALMQEALRYTDQHFPTRTLTISAQLYLLMFYQSFGFVQVSETYPEDDIPHIKMQRPAQTSAERE